MTRQLLAFAAVVACGAVRADDKPAAVGPPGFAWRTASERAKLLMDGGGNANSEMAVARGLGWLAKQQKDDGTWAFDGQSREQAVAATALCLLPFLSAGHTHQSDANVKYAKLVASGLTFLKGKQKEDGGFVGGELMYAHGLAAIALCEAYGMTGDKALKGPAQKAIDYIQKGQVADGSWGYYADAEKGDTSITGWQVQALHAARLCKGLTVDPKVSEKAGKFLDRVASGTSKEKYGYVSPEAPSLPLTAVGLLCRHTLGAWSAGDPGIGKGVQYLVKNWIPIETRMDLYYYYHATRVVRLRNDATWQKSWNPLMRDTLVKLQVSRDDEANGGSWDADKGMIGTACGRLGTTALALLTLETYYRYPTTAPAAEKPSPKK